MSEIDIKGVLKPTLLKIKLFFVLFLATSLVPIGGGGLIGLGNYKAQPAVIYLIMFIEKAEIYTNYILPLPVLYGISFITAYGLLYISACLFAQGIVYCFSKVFKKKEKGKGEQDG